jgi:4-amino-4-deoxy-L-arabinose transferase-like glycosyltransferase
MWARPGSRGVVLGIGCFFFGAYALILGRDNCYDLRYYHYWVAYAFLHHRIGFDYAPAQLQSYLNPLSFIPFYLLVHHLPAVVTGFLMGAWYGLTFGLIFLLAFELLDAHDPGPRFGFSMANAVLGTCGPIFIGTLGASYNDVTIAQLVLLAILLALRWWRGREPGREHRSGMLLASGVVLGMAVGFKMVNAFCAVAVLVALMALPLTWRSRARVGSVYVAMLAAGCLATSGYWMALLWSHFGSPTFPFFNAIFRSPYYPPTNFADRRFVPGGSLEALTYPLRLGLGNHREWEFRFRDWRYAILVVLGLGALIRWGWGIWRARPSRSKPSARRAEVTPDLASRERFVLVFFIVAYVLWQSLFGILRYAAPLEAMAPVVMILLARRAVGRRALHGVVLGVASVAILGCMRPFHSERLHYHEYIQVNFPRFEQPGRVLVVIAHNAPWAFALPSLQPEIRVLGLQSNLTKPWDKTRFQTEMRDILEHHDGEIYVLSDEGYLRQDLETLRKYYGLGEAGAGCHQVDACLQSIPFYLCPLRRTTP